jgi:hypothetical protein
MRVTGALFLAGAELALSTWAAVACTTADVRFSDFQFRRVSVTGVAITGEFINDCAEPVWGIIRLTFRNKRDVVDTQDIWPAGRNTIPPKSAYPVSWYFDIDPAWTTLEHKVVMVDTE